MTTSLLSALLADEAVDQAAIAARARAWEDMAAEIAERVKWSTIGGTLEPAVLTDAAMDLMALAQDLEVAGMERAA